MKKISLSKYTGMQKQLAVQQAILTAHPDSTIARYWVETLTERLANSEPVKHANGHAYETPTSARKRAEAALTRRFNGYLK